MQKERAERLAEIDRQLEALATGLEWSGILEQYRVDLKNLEDSEWNLGAPRAPRRRLSSVPPTLAVEDLFAGASVENEAAHSLTPEILGEPVKVPTENLLGAQGALTNLADLLEAGSQVGPLPAAVEDEENVDVEDVEMMAQDIQKELQKDLQADEDNISEESLDVSLEDEWVEAESSDVELVAEDDVVMEDDVEESTDMVAMDAIGEANSPLIEPSSPPDADVAEAVELETPEWEENTVAQTSVPDVTASKRKRGVLGGLFKGKKK